MSRLCRTPVVQLVLGLPQGWQGTGPLLPSRPDFREAGRFAGSQCRCPAASEEDICLFPWAPRFGAEKKPAWCAHLGARAGTGLCLRHQPLSPWAQPVHPGGRPWTAGVGCHVHRACAESERVACGGARGSEAPARSSYLRSAVPPGRAWCCARLSVTTACLSRSGLASEPPLGRARLGGLGEHVGILLSARRSR